MGISRSTTVVLAYLIATTKMTPREALAVVRSKRTIVRPNRGFMSQLEAYHSTCSHSFQAKLVDEELAPALVPAPDEDDQQVNKVRRRRGGGAAPTGVNSASGTVTAWSAKVATKSYVRSALTAATALPSFFPHQSGGRECWNFENRIS